MKSKTAERIPRDILLESKVGARLALIASVQSYFPATLVRPILPGSFSCTISCGSAALDIAQNVFYYLGPFWVVLGVGGKSSF